jgi:hypothetical protein
MMISANFAEDFARDWVDAWNAHDLERILAHYSDDFEMSSPIIAQLANEPSGVLHGKPAIAAYWRTALGKVPNLHFELLTVLAGANSVVIHYRGHRGLAAEMFWFNADGKVVKAAAHYQV